MNNVNDVNIVNDDVKDKTLKMWIFVENEKKVWNNSEVKMTKSLFPMIHISTSVARRPYHVSEESPPVSVTILHIKYYSQYET